MFAVPAVASTSTAPDSPPAQGDTKKPEATVESETVTQSDITDEDEGIKFSGSGFDGDKTARVVVTGTDGTEYKAEKKLTVNDKGEVNGSYYFTTTGGAKVPLGEYKLKLVGNDSKVESTEVTFTVVSDSEKTPTPTETPSETPNATPSQTPSQSASPTPTQIPSETPSQTPSASPTPTQDPKPEIGQIKAGASEVDEKDFLAEGLEFTGAGFSPNLKTEVTVTAPAEDGKEAATVTAEVTTDQEGQLAFTVKGAKNAPATPAAGEQSDEPAELTVPFASEYTVEVTAEDAEKTATTTFSVNAAPTQEPTKEPTEDPTATEEPSQEPTETQTSEPSESATPSETPSQTPSQTPSKSPVPTGQPTESDDKKAAPKLTIDPLEIASADFGKDGVKIIGENFEPGQKITMVVNHAQGKVKQYTTEVTADDNGVAAFRVRAVTTPVLGQYNVTVHPSDAAADGDQALHGSFTVITNGSSVGDETTGDTKKDTSGGTDLPRTGAELTGLAMGAGLLVIGAAAVVITRRRTAGGNGPADI
ncbi:LPXTG cell wall anchor domain-containing protein [Brevibacterium luteolum]|uniref:LPXTG cell wall anchor domain-containing protein n=1 Tax=Brevibacterium luteolum TaxID=199591 RepID=A0A6G8KXN3_9MICO|nr:LPXTG cell wall anchor domain-containing protein [Brevibacterium luteolum]QIN29552.1 LPXTG cell wall anchor domain-containing protein [Brevibacterium luteolum]